MVRTSIDFENLGADCYSCLVQFRAAAHLGHDRSSFHGFNSDGRNVVEAGCPRDAGMAVLQESKCLLKKAYILLVTFCSSDLGKVQRQHALPIQVGSLVKEDEVLLDGTPHLGETSEAQHPDLRRVWMRFGYVAHEVRSHNRPGQRLRRREDFVDGLNGLANPFRGVLVLIAQRERQILAYVRQVLVLAYKDADAVSVFRARCQES